METFNFPHFQLTTEHPESSTVVQFGKGYRFVSEPDGPDQIIYKLKFESMWWFVVNGVPSNSIEPTINVKRLEEFYERHRMSKKFQWAHPYRGALTVRFMKPLVIPPAEPNSLGLVKNISIEFITEF